MTRTTTYTVVRQYNRSYLFRYVIAANGRYLPRSEGGGFFTFKFMAVRAMKRAPRSGKIVATRITGGEQ